MHQALSRGKAGRALLGSLSPRCPLLSELLSHGTEGPWCCSSAGSGALSVGAETVTADARPGASPAGHSQATPLPQPAVCPAQRHGGAWCHTRRWRRPLPSRSAGGRRGEVPVGRPGWQGLRQLHPNLGGWPAGASAQGVDLQGHVGLDRPSLGLGNSHGDGGESSLRSLPLPRPCSPWGQGGQTAVCLQVWGPEPPRGNASSSGACTKACWHQSKAGGSATPQPLFSFNFSLCSEPESPPRRSGAASATLVYVLLQVHLPEGQLLGEPCSLEEEKAAGRKQQLIGTFLFSTWLYLGTQRKPATWLSWESLGSLSHHHQELGCHSPRSAGILWEAYDISLPCSPKVLKQVSR